MVAAIGQKVSTEGVGGRLCLRAKAKESELFEFFRRPSKPLPRSQELARLQAPVANASTHHTTRESLTLNQHQRAR